MKLGVILLLAQLAIGPPPCVERPGHTWHLLQKQVGGGIASIIHGLTKDECEFAKNRVEGLPATAEEKKVAHDAEEKRAAELKVKQDAFLRKHPQCHGKFDAGEGWGWGGSGESQGFVEKGGKCSWYYGDLRLGGTQMQMYGNDSVTSAECFQ